jgi:hypothetical protein
MRGKGGDEMSLNIAEAKQRLPLPELLARLGLGDRAKKSARCPFHEDGSNSFSVFQHNGANFWKCFAGCGAGDEITLLEKHEGLSRGEAIRRYCELAGVNGTGDRNAPLSRPVSPPAHEANADKERPDQSEAWRKCVAAFTNDHAAKLATWRGYSAELVGWLRERELVGLHNGKIAFPVHGDGGKVLAIHYRIPPKAEGERARWAYWPEGVGVRLLAIGDMAGAGYVAAFESQWDLLAVADKLGVHRKGGVPGWVFVATRGADNGKLLAGVVPKAAAVLAFAQNDAAGLKWLQSVADCAGVTVKHVATPAAHKDMADWCKAGATLADLDAAVAGAVDLKPQPDETAKRVVPVLEFLRPSELLGYRPPEGIVLAGDCHVVRGSVFVIGGAPGVGKSRAGVALGVAGATGADWFNLKVHARFRTMIVQNENGRFRLQREFADLDCPALEDFVRVCPPPPLGLAFDKVEFQAALTAAIADFRPDVILIDPWNAVARDEKARDYLDTFNVIRSVIPTGDNAPALGIVAHTRKPKNDERATGRGLLNLLAGSYVLGSVPRTAFVLQSASDDPTDARVVWTCCKNNDGELGERTAWQRRNGLFAPVADFDWTEFDRPASDRPTVTEADVADVFQHGQRSVRKAEAVADLQERTGAGKSACYNALKLDGRFAGHLAENEGLLTWTP